jgi:hypothetical protein
VRAARRALTNDSEKGRTAISDAPTNAIIAKRSAALASHPGRLGSTSRSVIALSPPVDGIGDAL